MTMSDQQRAAYQRMINAIKRAGMKSHALVAVDEGGHVYWGGSFAHRPEELLRGLRIIEHDVRQYIKWQKEQV